MPQTDTPARLDWSERVKALRRHLKLTSAALAKDLGITEKTLGLWEAGDEEPPPNSYLKLGNVAGEPSCWYFWERAGLYGGDLMRVLPAVRLHMRQGLRPDLQIAHAGSGERLFSKPQLHAIPLLPLKAAGYGDEGDKTIDFDHTAPEGLIAAPSHWAPNPAFTTCLRVKGESMAPVLCDGYIIAVDTSQTDLAKLIDKIVIAWHPVKGINVAWLKIAVGGEELVSQSAKYRPIVLGRDKDWRVIGKVIWWIGRNG